MPRPLTALTYVVSRNSYGFAPEEFDPTLLPDVDIEFVQPDHLDAFSRALAAPSGASGNSSAPACSSRVPATGEVQREGELAPVLQAPAPSPAEMYEDPILGLRRQRHYRPRQPRRPSIDDVRASLGHSLLRWPLLVLVLAYLALLCAAYSATRALIRLTEVWRIWGNAARLRREMARARTYQEWVHLAVAMDHILGLEDWKWREESRLYDAGTVKEVVLGLDVALPRARGGEPGALEEVRRLVEACVKRDFAGVENARIYSRTHVGTKKLVERFVDQVEESLNLLASTGSIPALEKRAFFKRLSANYGRTALCLSGGATFAYHHFGVVRALLEEDVLPDIITGTSGGALVASLVGTRTDDELRQLLVPALATRITACADSLYVWLIRWWRTGARFDPVEWARLCSWWTRGSLTFREAYERTGRILNISCVPADDPHSPPLLCNYLTAPDCVIWSAVLASAAVPGLLPPVVLMNKNLHTDELTPFSLGTRWRDGSLRTDIPLRALNNLFNVTFSVVSQTNPHINTFFFPARGSVGQPVAHRQGRGWRGGFLLSALEHIIRLDLHKWLRFLRSMDILPRWLGQDWSNLWLQSALLGTITVWPAGGHISDYFNILTDPDAERLARMIRDGMLTMWPAIHFIRNRLRVERAVERGRGLCRD